MLTEQKERMNPPVCSARKTKFKIYTAQEINDWLEQQQKTKGGQCLATKPFTRFERILFQCAEGHRFRRPWESIRQGHWCSECHHKRRAAKRRYSETELKDQARRVGLELVDSSIAGYKNEDSKLQYRCLLNSEHGIIIKPVYLVASKKGCPSCGLQKRATARRRYSVAQAKQFGEKAGLKLISETFTNLHKELEWECQNCGARRFISLNAVKKRKSFACGQCRQITKTNTRNAAANCGFSLTSYRGYGYLTLHEFRCDKGHIVELHWEDLNEGRKCKYCECLNEEEELCRSIFEELFDGTPFPKYTPHKLEWLVHEGSFLELDGLSLERGVAFEYQGPDHNTINGRFNKGRQEVFEDRIDKDAAKVKLCAKQKITLVPITGFPRPLSREKATEIVKRALQNHRVSLRPKRVSVAALP